MKCHLSWAAICVYAAVFAAACEPVDAGGDGGAQDAASDSELPDGELPDGELPDAEPGCEEGSTRPCVAGEGCFGFETCVAGVFEACTAPDERCDGVDNDCDGEVDEGFDGLGDACEAGEGACLDRGWVVCAADGAGTMCDARPGDLTAEACDGVDNDCDGEVDDGVEVGIACETGRFGVCGAGATVCVEGDTRCAPAAEPSAELCDGLDNDCDGEIDEGEVGGPLAEPCYDGPAASEGVGQCAGGVRVCGGGAFGACEGQVLPGDEICDTVDNDCDGVVDSAACVCTPGEVQSCYGGPAGTAGVGVCLAGTQVCLDDGSSFGPCAGAVEPGVEACNGVDDDCNGEVDDVPGVGEACSAGAGVCAADGVRACAPALGRVVCSAEPGPPADEICDGFDNDCDGVVDDLAGAGAPCEAGVGACLARGVMRCDEAGALSCSAVAGAPGVEVCDDVDNDCNGVVDDAPGVAEPCEVGVGACRSTGVTWCSEAGVVCGAVPREAAAADYCDNGVDDDCDGEADEAGCSPLCEADDSCPSPNSCAGIRFADPTADDGDYVLAAGGDPTRPVTVYCHDMAGEPREYLTLVEVGGDRNVSRYIAGGASPGETVTTHFSRVRFDVEALVLHSGDFTFSSSAGRLNHNDAEVTRMPYGSAQQCAGGGGAPGVGNVDLRGTPFAIETATCVDGFAQNGRGDVSAGGQVVDLSVVGFCGWAMVSDSCAAAHAGGAGASLRLRYIDSCGDGVRSPDEACDDGDREADDGCDGACAVEPGWVCGPGELEPCDEGEVFSVARAEPGETLPAVGQRGAPTADECAPGEVVVGYDLGEAAYFGRMVIGKIRAACARVEVVDGAVTLPPTELTRERGITGGLGLALRCPAGQVVTGYTGAANDGYVSGLGLTCRPLTLVDGRLSLGPPADVEMVGDPGDEVVSHACADGVATSNVVFAGDVLDRFTIRCDTLVELCPGPDVCMLDCSGDDCPSCQDRCDHVDCEGDPLCVEQCDDGEDNDGDGLADCDDADCVEDAFCLPAVCGDGRRTGGEPCDDGGRVDGDGCSADCVVEPGFTCIAPPPGVEPVSFVIHSRDTCGAPPPNPVVLDVAGGFGWRAYYVDGAVSISGDGRHTGMVDVRVNGARVPGALNVMVPGLFTTPAVRAAYTGVSSDVFTFRDGAVVTAGFFDVGCADNRGSIVAELRPVDACHSALCGNARLDPDEGCDDGVPLAYDGCSSTCQVEDGFTCSPPTVESGGCGGPLETIALGGSIDLPLVGALGGAEFALGCPAGSALVGLDVRVGDEWFRSNEIFLQRVRAICAAVELGGGPILAPGIVTASRGGGAGEVGIPDGFNTEVRCPEGHIVRGFRAAGRPYVRRLSLVCSPLDYVERRFVIGPPAELDPIGDLDAEAGELALCNDGWLASGIVGRAGDLIDAFSVRCSVNHGGGCHAPSVCSSPESMCAGFCEDLFTCVETGGVQGTSWADRGECAADCLAANPVAQAYYGCLGDALDTTGGVCSPRDYDLADQRCRDLIDGP